jgi:hypothetical protein
MRYVITERIGRQVPRPFGEGRSHVQRKQDFDLPQNRVARLFIVGLADENEGLEAEAIPHHQSQAGDGDCQEGPAFLEGHEPHSSGFGLEHAFLWLRRPQSPSACRFGTRVVGFLATSPPFHLTAHISHLHVDSPTYHYLDIHW